MCCYDRRACADVHWVEIIGYPDSSPIPITVLRGAPANRTRLLRAWVLRSRSSMQFDSFMVRPVIRSISTSSLTYL